MAPSSKTLALFTAVLALGCNADLGPDTNIQLAGKSEETKQIPWGSRDNPNIFASDLVYTVSDLPREGGAASAPWASSYWPTYQDNINYKWDGADSLSPAAKYGEAFGIEGIEDAVSRYHGIDSRSSATVCKEDSECDSDLAEKCAIRDGKDEGRCVPTWFGICHAWAPASILQPEAVNPVTHNGVEFKVNDIKALVTLVHEGVVTRFASRRCNENDSNGDIEYDEYGRPKNGDCIDTNPGTFHLLLTNFLGLRQESFVYDRTYDYQVWNQPLRDFDVTEMTEVDGLRANELIGATSTGGTTTELEATVEQGAWHHFDAIAVEGGDKVTVRMSGSGDGDLHVRFGSQADDSNYDCRPYDSGSSEVCELDVPADATQMFVSVNGYSEAEVDVNVTVGGEAPTEYLFNDRAVKWFEVRLTARYISESSSSTDGNLADRIDNYTHTDRYHYILEIDEDDRIIGGEWLGSSKTAHPDFLWLPVRSGRQSAAGGKIKYSEVIGLLNQSLVDDEQGGEGADREVRENGTVSRNEMVHFGPYPTAVGTQLVAAMTGTGDADLYVRRGAPPTVDNYDCRPYKNGSDEDCTVDGPGDIYVAVHGYAQQSTFNLQINYTEPGDGEGDPVDPGDDDDDTGSTAHLSESGDVAQGAFEYFELQVEAGQAVVVRTQAPNDVDLYVQFGRRPTTSDHAGIGYTASGNEEVLYTASASGTLHIGVHGYAASSFTLTTADPG
jgi:hypothetical protein